MRTKTTSITNDLPKFNSKSYFKILNAVTVIASICILFASACKKDNFVAVRGVCPVVTTDPMNGAVDVLLPKVITATFNTAMDPKTITSSTFIIKQAGTVVAGTVAATANPAVFVFTPSVPLLPFTVYTGTITTGATNKLNTSLSSNYIWSFTTIPEVTLSANPAIGGTTGGAGTFVQGSFTAVTATPNVGYYFANWTNNGTVVSTSSSYSFTMAGNKALVANFAQAAPGEFVVVLSSNPAIGGTTNGSGAFNAASTVIVTASPNNGYTFANWTNNGTIVSASATYVFALNAPTSLVANFSLNPIGIGPGVVNLGAAGAYTILTESGISTTGITSIQGDIGVSPISATAITGFGLILNTGGQSSHTPIVSGSVYSADYASPTPANLTSAINDMQTAYTTENNLITPAPVVNLYAGDVSGKILPPGLYKWTTGLLVSSAGVTLSGGPNDTWVFQIAQDLTVSNSAIITLSGGAQAKNIVWVVAGKATLGSNVNFSGIILSKTLISLNTGATVTGLLFAQSAVTLNASTIVKP